VAQRTGATVYYVELFPRDLDNAHQREPVLSTMPTPGEVDIVIASELMEAGRAIQRGFATPDRTVLIASTSRVYSMPERTAMGDGRIDSAKLIDAAKNSTKRFLRADFAQIATEARSVISASLFGALAASGELPFTREQFEAAIRSSGKGVEASLRAFDAGHRAAIASERPVIDISIGPPPAKLPADPGAPDPEVVARAAEQPASLVGTRLTAQAERIKREFPAPARYFLVEGIKRTAEYQDTRYADEYLDRVARVLPFESDDQAARLTTETARYVALWMTYEDTIRVAFHKTREKRFSRVHDEARVEDDSMMQVHEYLHPQIEEIADTLPTKLGRWVLGSGLLGSLIHKITHKGIKIQSTSVFGFTALYFLARLRPIRRRSLRFGQEQARIDAWLAEIVTYAGSNYDLGCEIVECQQVVKGYGQTHANGMRNFELMMGALPDIAASQRPAARLASLRNAALADEQGEALRQALGRASV
jgi:indolepyruvate ferredoxin oxidoreductase beta subunit